MDDTVITQMNRFKAQLLAQETIQMQQMAARWLQVENALEAHIDALTRQMDERRANGESISQGALFRLQRYQTLLAQLNQAWGSYATYAATTIQAGQETAGNLGISHAINNLEAIQSGISLGFNRLPQEAIENMAGMLADGNPLPTLLLNNALKASVVDEMSRALLNGTALGWNPRKTARLMRDKLAGGLNQALTIARTEQLRVYRELNRQQYQASGVVEGYYRLATRDNRTCAACLAADGEFFELDEVMSEHPNGRCAQVPKVKGFAPPQWQKGPDWLRNQPTATQRQILGQGRFEAWQRGDFNLVDLISIRRDGVWGSSIQTTPLQELTAG